MRTYLNGYVLSLLRNPLRVENSLHTPMGYIPSAALETRELD